VLGFIKQSELITVPQYKRVERMREVIPAWMAKLSFREVLVVGLPACIDSWENAALLVLKDHMIADFKCWLESSAEIITGPNYNLPPLNTHFLLMVIDIEYDPNIHEIPKHCSEAMRATLKNLATHIRSQTQSAH
jgi:hypothetical protein